MQRNIQSSGSDVRRIVPHSGEGLQTRSVNAMLDAQKLGGDDFVAERSGICFDQTSS